MEALRISLFGRLDVQHDGRPLSGLEARKVQELFCYLLIFRNSPHPREMLATLLWENNSTGRSRKYLRQALWQLQSAVEPDLLELDPEWIQFNPAGNCWLDVALFEDAYAQTHGIPGHDLAPEDANVLHEAVQLYRGELLEGWHSEWCLFERERFQTMYLAMLDKLLCYCETNNLYETGLVYGTCILRCDRARERTRRRLMRLHYQAGNRTAALREFQACVAALHEELGVGPSKSTIALYEQIRADEWTAPTARTAVTQTDDLGHILLHLRQMQNALADMQRQIQKDIRAVEAAQRGSPHPGRPAPAPPISSLLSR